MLPHSGLLTDLYELTMAAAYVENGVEATASFELFVRSLPPQRGYLLTAGLEQALEFLEQARFSGDDVAFLRAHPAFGRVGPRFFEYLREFRFSGEVWAMPEGTVAFAAEPLLRVTAPIVEAQMVETYLLTAITFQTSIASKAARIAEAAQGRGVVEFGTRRAHGPEAGVLAARAAFIGGCVGTSNVEAGRRFAIPTYGTMAHSFVMAYADEEQAFRDFYRVFPDHAVLLVDTYDTLAAVEKIIAMGLRPRGVRLDSGDLGALARETRRLLDQGGLRETRIFASGDLDEHAIRELLAQGAPLDLFGVGTELATSRDAPALGGVYKLVEMEQAGQPFYAAKFSPEKVTYPGKKQVFRCSDSQGLYQQDVIGRSDEQQAKAEPLLECVMRQGRRVGPAVGLHELQQRARLQLEKLPARYKVFQDAPTYPVRISAELDALLQTVRKEHQRPRLAGSKA